MSDERIYVIFNRKPAGGGPPRNQVDPGILNAAEGATIAVRNTRPRRFRIATGTTQLFVESVSDNGIWVTAYVPEDESLTLTLVAPAAPTPYSYCVLFNNAHGSPHEGDVCRDTFGVRAAPGDDPGIQIGG